MSATVKLVGADEIAHAELAREGLPKETPLTPHSHGQEHKTSEGTMSVGKVNDLSHSSLNEDEYDDYPTEEDMKTLRRVSGKINWAAYSVAVCELAERFSYYGSSVLYTNFVVQPLPDGSNTGAGFGRGGQSGALGLGSRAGQGISLTNTFFAYFVPLFG